MATPGDTLRAQAEVRLKQLERKVTAHRKVKDDEEADKAQAEVVALTSVLKYIDETSDEMIPVRIACSELEVAVAGLRRSCARRTARTRGRTTTGARPSPSERS